MSALNDEVIEVLRLGFPEAFITDRGFPDLLMVTECGELVFIEIKTTDRLSIDQQELHDVLDWNDIPVCVLRVITMSTGQKCYSIEQEHLTKAGTGPTAIPAKLRALVRALNRRGSGKASLIYIEEGQVTN